MDMPYEEIQSNLKDIESIAQDVYDIVGEQRIQGVETDILGIQGLNGRLRKIYREFDGEKKKVKTLLDAIPTTPSTVASLSSISNKNEASENLKPLSITKVLMTSLQVSYDKLKPRLKDCLLCFSVFPENAVIKKRQVIYWWIGEGLVIRTRDKTVEEVGEIYFKELIQREFIEPVPIKRKQDAKSCKMHPIIRRMVILVAKRQGFFKFNEEQLPTINYSTSGRACLMMNFKVSSQMMLDTIQKNKDNLRTLLNVNQSYLELDKTWISKMKKVTTLQLGRWKSSPTHHIEVVDTDFLEGLGDLDNLRYLSLNGISRITKLPNLLSNLGGLIILDLRACHNLERLPDSVTSLKKLRHLDVSDCYLLDHMPKGLSSLSELQVLKGFVIGNSRSKDPCKLSELRKLVNLRKLSINIGGEAVVSEEELGQMVSFEALRSLTITWGWVGTATLALECFSLPSNLEKLDLRCFPNTESPGWLKPSNLKSLKKLYIRGGPLEILSGGPWTTVEVLRLKFLAKFQTDWTSVKSAFPRLVYFEAFNCPMLDMDSFPCDKEDGVWVKDME
ncbi:Disease resistance RPP13-like protein 4 [Acorus calamus]|uniref:Disease resistance RPP13-like protein 4 n=1 Tax=Acorus calamus TaxID=4465 RepID=A0AAV9D287_ACOCL|nr:Disease resistance RPP13-like protein 4 [Acorus calamus]